MEKALSNAKAFAHWALRPVRALGIAYSHVLSGTKVSTPMRWSDI